MTRRIIGFEQPTAANPVLAEKLLFALKHDQETGQPLIYEQQLGPTRLRVTVVWDEWEGMPMDERTAVVVKAYELADDASLRDRIALVTGFTVPEATAAGLLPYQVGTALRKGDPITIEQCRSAMLAEGASTLFGPNLLQLRFATREEAEECRSRLIKRLPGSEDIWLISIEVSVQDRLAVYDSATSETS